jgi:Fe-S cluster biosynthesis and repair protein YggX
MTRMVHCVKFNRKLPGLGGPPLPGELGERIYENVSSQAWDMWKDHVVILINHYGLNMADPKAQDFINAQLEEFFFGEGAQLPDDWVAEGQGGKGGPPAKGAPAPPQK